MSSKPPSQFSDQPRSEPEIIPPGHGKIPGIAWASVGERRIHVTRLGPFSIALLLLAIATITALVGILLIGTFLIWIPVIALLIAGTTISTWWRRGRRSGT
jgi:hypothetical protein